MSGPSGAASGAADGPGDGGPEAPGAGSGAEVRVVAAVLRREDRYLVARRPRGKRHAGLWEFPGGKVRPGENDLDAVARELREELALDVRALGATLHAARDPGTPFVVVFVEVEASGEPRPVEHDELRWCDPAELRALSLAPSDADFVASALP